MIILNENYQDLEVFNKIFHLRGFSISEISIREQFDIIFQKGIGITLTKRILDLYKDVIFEKGQGYIRDTIGHLIIYMHFFKRSNGSTLVIIYIDNIENLMDYTELYSLSKKLYIRINQKLSKIEIRNLCTNIVNIPRAKGLVGIFVLDKAGFLFFSKVKKDKPNLANNNFQIAGFISAILIYVQDFIAGEEYGLRLQDINLGEFHLFLKTKNDVIFAYIIDKDKSTENIKRYMQLIVEEFLETYYASHVIGFKGDLSPFHDFEKVIDQYFEI